MSKFCGNFAKIPVRPTKYLVGFCYIFSEPQMEPKETMETKNTIPTCTIIYDESGFHYRDEDGTFLEKHRLDFVTDELLDALQEMSAYYDDLDFVGYWDEELGAFVITKVINNFDGSALTNHDLDEMMYIAPECAHDIIKITNQETGIVLDVEL